MTLLHVKYLTIALPRGADRPNAIQVVSFDLNPGETLGIGGQIAVYILVDGPERINPHFHILRRGGVNDVKRRLAHIAQISKGITLNDSRTSSQLRGGKVIANGLDGRAGLIPGNERVVRKSSTLKLGYLTRITIIHERNSIKIGSKKRHLL